MERETYKEILDNFEQFCDEFEGAAAKRYSGVDDASREPVTNESVERITPTVVREVDGVGEEDFRSRTPTIDVPSTEV